MVSSRTGERGFTLLELLLCAGILAFAGAATAGALAALARNAGAPAVRDAALDVAENALVRARAAVAYAPGATKAPRTWGLLAGATTFSAGADLPGACGMTTRVVPLSVTTTYDPATERFTVVVRYPRDPCANAAAASAAVTLGETLPPSAFAPGTTLDRDIATPARM